MCLSETQTCKSASSCWEAASQKPSCWHAIPQSGLACISWPCFLPCCMPRVRNMAEAQHILPHCCAGADQQHGRRQAHAHLLHKPPAWPQPGDLIPASTSRTGLSVEIAKSRQVCRCTDTSSATLGNPCGTAGQAAGQAVALLGGLQTCTHSQALRVGSRSHAHIEQRGHS